MSRRSWMIALVMCSLLVVPAFVRAQDQNQGQGQGQGNNDRRGRGANGGNFDPAQFRQQMMDRMKEQLGANDDEWKILEPKIEKVTAAQRDARFGGFGGFGRGGRGGRDGGGGGGNQPQSAVGQAAQDLRQTLENKDASADDISAKLKTLRDARQKAQEDLASAQKELKEVLTQRQEATLVSYGMLD
jgi:hypothetical protein